MAAQLPCPRCGYDQSGIAREHAPDAFPERGRCSECGLDYLWLDVLYAERRNVPWLVEHTEGRARTFKAAWTTWARTFLPFVFFSAVRLEHRVNPRRVLLWLALVLLPVHAAAATLASARVAILPTVIAGRVSRQWTTLDYISTWLYPIVTLRPGASGFFPPRLVPILLDAPVWVFPALAMHAGYAISLPILRSTLGAAKVRPAHLFRAFVYGLSWVVLLAMFRLGRNLLLLYETLAGPGPGGTPIGAWAPQPLRLERIDPLLVGGLVMSFIALWWMAALVRGWRLGEAWLVWLLLTIIAVLCAAITGAYWDSLLRLVSP